MTYADAIQFLYSLRWLGAKFGLENALKLAALAGNPHQRLRFIHVAGTNGKGSTCAMLESIYRAAGLRVGLFTSPHLVAFGERLQVNRRPIAEDNIARLVAEMRALIEQGWQEAAEHPTFFEVVTVMALRYFVEQKCELVIWETGLGGRLDATNIVTPLASVITNIQFDHQKWLGDSLASIAAEKAGIIKTGIPVLTAAESPEAIPVIVETARRQNAPLTMVSSAIDCAAILDQPQLPLLGRHQKVNAALAVATVRALAPVIPVGEEAIRAGLSQVQWPGRLQLIIRPSGQRVLLDGAHNVGGAEILAAALPELFPSANRTLVLGILQDKDWPAMCRLLAPLAARILLVPVPSDRTATPSELAEVCHRFNPAAHVVELPSLSAALEESIHDPFVVIAGSLYLVGEALERLDFSMANAPRERELNEWKMV